MNTNYDWKNVSDEHLDDIIAREQKCVIRFIRYGQTAKLERAESNIETAHEELTARLRARIDARFAK